MYHLDNNHSITAITPTMVWREEIKISYTLILNIINITIINNYEVKLQNMNKKNSFGSRYVNVPRNSIAS